MSSKRKRTPQVTPNGSTSLQKRLRRSNEYLNECIRTILKREFLHLDVGKIIDILSYDLQLNLKNITPCMRYILADCFCYYMKSWIGWKNYDAVCVNEQARIEYIEKLKEYLKIKIKHVVDNEQSFNPPSYDSKNMQSKEVQTQPISKKLKPEAPYKVVISGKPNILSNIVFIELNNDVVVKQHAEKPWSPLSVKEFLNYSFVFASMKLPDIEMSRSNIHEFQRYITECGDSATCPDVDFITYIRKLTSDTPKVYTMDYIQAYFKQFIEVIGKIPGYVNSSTNGFKNCRAEVKQLC